MDNEIKEEKPGSIREGEEGDDDKIEDRYTRRERSRERSRSRSSEYSYSSAETARNERRHATTGHQGSRRMRRSKKKPPRRTGRVTKRRRPDNKLRRRQRLASGISITTGHSGGSPEAPMCKCCGQRCCPTGVKYNRIICTRGVDSRTSFTSQQSSLADHIYCAFCHHRCPRRRSEAKKRRLKDKRKSQPSQPSQISKGPPESCQLEKRADSAQAGAPCPMLSKLFVASNSEPGPDAPDEQQCSHMYSQVTPEMIYESLRLLTMWRDGVPTEAIYKHIKRNYPVNPDPKEVMPDLLEKLRVASIAGIVWAVSDDYWRLCTELETMNKLDKTHVTLFWRAYGDTMKPLDRSVQPKLKSNREDKQAGTEESMEEVDYTDPSAII